MPGRVASPARPRHVELLVASLEFCVFAFCEASDTNRHSSELRNSSAFCPSGRVSAVFARACSGRLPSVVLFLPPLLFRFLSDLLAFISEAAICQLGFAAICPAMAVWPSREAAICIVL